MNREVTQTQTQKPKPSRGTAVDRSSCLRQWQPGRVDLVEPATPYEYYRA
jgi:hypothetical protein